jgi:glycosyltransferase involved in cell wall biosynthesis
VGEIGEREKNEFLGHAYALLVPIEWPEPFGLVMAEAMACGTPVIAYRRGSVPEIIEDGVTGFIVDSLEEAVRATERVSILKRSHCRQQFEGRFSAARMARDYLASYQRLVEGTLETEAAMMPDVSEAIRLARRAVRPRASGAATVP